MKSIQQMPFFVFVSRKMLLHLCIVKRVYLKNNEKIVAILKDLSKDVLNTEPEIRGCGPANEGYMFIGAGIPTICGFGVKGDGMHSKDEYLDINSIPKILEVYVQASLLV